MSVWEANKEMVDHFKAEVVSENDSHVSSSNNRIDQVWGWAANLSLWLHREIGWILSHEQSCPKWFHLKIPYRNYLKHPCLTLWLLVCVRVKGPLPLSLTLISLSCISIYYHFRNRFYFENVPFFRFSRDFRIASRLYCSFYG